MNFTICLTVPMKMSKETVLVISLCGRTYQTKAAMWGDMFYSATITLVPPVTLVLHGLIPLHSLYNIHVLLHNIYDIPFLLSKYL